VDRGHFGERADLGDRDVQPASGEQVEDSVQASPPPGAGTSWVMALPTPPLAECTSTLSPGRNLAASPSRSSPVVSMSGAAAATARDSWPGTGATNSARVRATAARPPPAVNAATCWPTASSVTPGPVSPDRPRHLDLVDLGAVRAP
jgi:hypothetical protein